MQRKSGWCVWTAVGLLPHTVHAADPKPPPPNPAEPVDYVAWMNQTFGAGIEDNVFDAYGRVYEQVEPFEGDWGRTLHEPWSDNPAVADWVDRHDRALAKFRRAARKEGGYLRLDAREPTGDARVDGLMILTPLSGLRPHLSICQGLIADGFRAWHDGDQARLPSNALRVLRSGRHFDTCPVFGAWRAGLYCAFLSYSSLREALHLADDPGSLASELLPQLTAADPPLPTLEGVFLFERFSTWDLWQRIFVPGRNPGTWTVHGPVMAAVRRSGVTLEPTGLLAFAGYDERLRDFNTQFDALDRWIRTPYWQAASQEDQLVQRLEQSENPLVRVVLPSLPRARMYHERLRAYRHATHLICALLAQQERRGRLPETLDDLEVPGLGELRIDPFSGRDLVYRRTGDDFTLYTVGDNLRDDGGKHDRKWGETTPGDFVFWPVQPRE